ncbi:NAD(P)/FAD-dependent oxidoreductase [Serpentinimonas maccroryi]|uniref:NAD(P)/FAD-dependent oxidoreductase n=1 Tax=Serpentinimonas maccroryi TaxID=1458426 RepID=UPI0020336706|nr:aminoacetone oxidase family FAD-binding enzyme [Serpentinimonas maccroryi]MCM2478503.1 aminoacetone oxidase family FAD-binding enzyme [Serpentinimonas maccroryi]
MTPVFDVVIVGAGAAGLFCAGIAGQRGLRVLLLDHAPKVAEKIRISGGGRCNFTNRELDPRQPQRHFLSQNPAFCRSALARYTPADFIALLQRHGVAFEEKHKGQLFCSRSAQDLIALLLHECGAGGVTHWQPCGVRAVHWHDGAPGSASYRLETERGAVAAHAVVVATGGLPVPKIGASDWGLRLAQRFGLGLVEPRPALVPLTFEALSWAPYAHLAGLALPVRIATGSKKQAMAFDEDLLFTHRGLSGPAGLQISSYWNPGQPLRIDLHPKNRLDAALQAAKAAGGRKLLPNALAQHLPQRLCDIWTQHRPDWQRPLSDCSDKALAQLAESLHHWAPSPSGDEGWAKAEVMRGGVDTRQLSSQSLESSQPGLYFIGEVVDVTGWLGGYNFQWAWASAHACALALPPSPH